MWLEFIVPAVVLIIATPSATIAFIYARYSCTKWSGSLFGFLVAASGVSLLSAIGIFLKASGVIQDQSLYFIIWNLSFLILGTASWLAIKTGLLATGESPIPRFRFLFIAWSVVFYIINLIIALGRKDDLYFPYIGGTYAATSLYLFSSLGLALFIVLRGRKRLTAENEGTLRRFLHVFPPFCAVFFFDELFRATTQILLPWPPLLPLAPLLLYLFSSLEILKRMRHDSLVTSDQAMAKQGVMAIAERCKASPLTPRERDVLTELLKGESNSTIAAHLGISANTVKNHIYSIFQKTGAGSRGELFLFADCRAQSLDSQNTPNPD